MKSKPPLAMLAALVVLVLVVIGAAYWKTLGPGKTSAQESKWSKPPEMNGPLVMPVVPPPPPRGGSR